MTVRLYFPFCVLGVLISFRGLSQPAPDTISKESVKKIITYLASNELGGRVNYTKEQLKAAEFISNEFTSYGLKPFPGFTNFYQPFQNFIGNASSATELKWNEKKIEDSLYYFFSHTLISDPLELEDFLVLQVYPPIAPDILYHNWQGTENVLIQIILPDSIAFAEVIKEVFIPEGMPGSHVLLVAKTEDPVSVKIKFNKNLANSTLYNIIGIVPGRSLPDEAIIFSAHYDHVDRGVHGEFGGTYNGANDNASGTTAVIELAKYFSMRKDNERTLIFCLFAGEEIGLLGSYAFSNVIITESIKAVLNIEMIGVHNISGKNSFMLTGSNYSSLYDILSQNLQGDKVSINRQNSDPRNLFERSDNYPFAKDGIPAHTIMSSDDNEPCYHMPCDKVNRIDLDNMLRIIKAIAKSAATLISGKDTPTRIKNL